MNQAARFSGVWTALVTPMDSKGVIDWDTYCKLLASQRDAGIAGVIPCGTTGEAPTLTREEKQKLITTAVSELKGSKTLVVAGTGSNSTAETVEFSRWASDQGVAGVLVVTPYYNKPSQSGLIAHYRAIGDAVSCPVMLYNVPGRTGVSFTAATVAALAEHPRLLALKEATGNVAFATEVRVALQERGRTMDILSGDDATYFPLLAVGATGVVSVASNLFPRAMVAIQKAWEAGQVDEARALHERYFPLFRDLFVESNPGPIKEALLWVGMIKTSFARAPLAPMAAAARETLLASLKVCAFKAGGGLA